MSAHKKPEREFQVSVYRGHPSLACRIHGKRTGCKSKAEFYVFEGDGEPYSSRLGSSVCAEHLVEAVRAALEQNEKDALPEQVANALMED